jgi:hypothetical protein
MGCETSPRARKLYLVRFIVSTKLLSVANSLVAHNLPSIQAALLENFRINIESLKHSRPDLLLILDNEIPYTISETLAVVEEEALGLTLYEKREQEWVVLSSKSASLLRAKAYQQTGYSILYFLGVGFGDEISAWHSVTINYHPLPNMRIPIYVFEQKASYFLLFLITADRRALLEDERVLLFIGNVAFSFYREKGRDGYVNLPSQKINLSFAINRNELDGLLNQSIDFIIDKTDRLCFQYLTEMTRYYDQSFGLRLAKKIQEKSLSSLKIMALTSRYTSFLQYGTRDWVQGFEALGCQVSIVIEPNDYFQQTQEFTIKRIYHFLPDIIISIDGLRDQFVPANVPFYSWIQDDLPRLANPKLPRLTNYDFVSLLGSGWLPLFIKRAFYQSHKLSVLPLGFNPGIYYPIVLKEKDIDVLYISHLIDPELTLQPYRELRLPNKKTDQELNWLQQNGNEESLHAAMKILCNWIDAASMDQLLPIFDDVHARGQWLKTLLTDIDDTMLVLLSEFEGNRARIGNDILSQLKIRPMRLLANANISFSVYGNNWHYFPEFVRQSAGVAANGEELNYLQNRAKICINNSAQISFHMRALEIMASGAFMLSRRIPKQHDIMNICELFNESTEVVLFDEYNLVDVVRYYLARPELRDQIAQAALAKLEVEHTYQHRAWQVLQEIQARFSSDEVVY